MTSRPPGGATNLTPGDTKADHRRGPVRDPGPKRRRRRRRRRPDDHRQTARRRHRHRDQLARPPRSAASFCSGVGSGEVTCTLPAAVAARRGSPAPGQPGPARSPSPRHPPATCHASTSTSRSPPKRRGRRGPTPPRSPAAAPRRRSATSTRCASTTRPRPSASCRAASWPTSSPPPTPSAPPPARPPIAPSSCASTSTSPPRTGVNDGPGDDGTRYITSNGQLRTVEVTLPRGMIGNPEATPKCDPADFAESGAMSTARPPARPTPRSAT